MGARLMFALLFFSFVLSQNYNFAESEKKISTSSDINDPVRFSFDNILGKDTSINATGRLTENYLYLKGGVEKRNLFEGPYFAGMDASGRSWGEEEFDLKGAGGDFYFGRRVTDFTRADLKYRFDQVDVSDTDSRSAIDFTRYDGTTDISALSLNIQRSTLDDAFYPNGGTEIYFITEYALKSLGGNANFSRYEGSFAYFVTPRWDITLGAHVRAGWMEDFGSSKDVPFFERYFAGSSSTVRGFKWGKAGPISRQNVALGGDVLVAANLEARFPVYKKLKGVVFFDTGRAFNKLDELGQIDFREGAGLGLRYLTPWMVLRADYGFVVDKREGEDTGRLHLTLGMPF